MDEFEQFSDFLEKSKNQDGGSNMAAVKNRDFKTPVLESRLVFAFLISVNSKVDSRFVQKLI